MSAASISKIHVSNSTGLSLNERFTAIHSVHPEQRRRSRSRSIPRNLAPSPSIDRAASLANRRLLQQLARRHKMQAALKLKRRSMRPLGNGIAMKRGSIKALRVAANGRPIRANTLSNVATMEADFVTNGSSRRPFRRSNSLSSISGRLGSRRPVVGGAAQRVARRRQDRVGSGGNSHQQPARRGRSRSRSRARLSDTGVAAGNARGRSLSRGRAGVNLRGRSLSRGRPVANVRGAPSGRSRSRSRGRGHIEAGARSSVPIKARLGLRPGTNTATARGERRNQLRGNAGGRPNRSSSISRRGVAQGRVQKRRNSVAQGVAVGGGFGGGNRQRAGGAGGRVGRSRGRSTNRNLVGRARSQTRKGTVGQQKPRSASTDRNGRSGRRGRSGRSQQRNSGGFRRGGLSGATQRNGKANGTNGQQQRRGRSRSRAGGRGRGIGRGGNQGKNGSPQVNKDALDKELDQYMATTKTENDMDYLLKN